MPPQKPPVAIKLPFTPVRLSDRDSLPPESRVGEEGLMEFLFPEVLRILVAVFLVVALIKFLAWLVRGFGSEQTGAASRRSGG